MLCLLFHVKETRFVFDTSYVVEVIHRVNPIRGEDDFGYFDGNINYHEEIISLVDFSRLYSGERCGFQLHSRIIVLESLDERKMGVLAEGVIEVVEVEPWQFLENRMEVRKKPYLSGYWNTPTGVIKNVDVPLLFNVCYQGAASE